MKIFGYEKDSESLLSLEEMSILCTIQEIDMLIEFLKYSKQELKSVEESGGTGHCHFRDYSKEWEKGNPDFIIVTENK